MRVEIIKCLSDNYSYILIDEKINQACVIDPSEADPIIKFIDTNKIDLKFILNTHHHYDHVGGNEILRKKYKSDIVGYNGDKARIPGINITVEDGQVWKQNNFEAKIIHIPGHTSGHICFYFFQEKIAFTGDTLFSLGCGKIFEGTYEQMYNSLNKLKELPKETKIYCGHEYTKKNYFFCVENDPENEDLKKKGSHIDEKLKRKLPTIPSTMQDELACNVFLRAKNVAEFSKLRDLKDNF